MDRRKITFRAKFEPIEKINDEFLKVKIYVHGLGKNRNLSHISRASADEALYSLYNIPVIGHLYEDEEGNLHMGGHDMAVEKDSDGKYKYKSLCVPYGVVPRQDNVHYEDIKEPKGNIVTYVVAEAILWVGRYPELLDAAYSSDCLFNQSMEINVIEHEPLEDDKNYEDIKKYTYSALCLLGKSDEDEFNVEPCFPESRVSVSYDLEHDNRFFELMDELKKDLSRCFAYKYDGKEEDAEMDDEVKTGVNNEQNTELENHDEEGQATDEVESEGIPVEAGVSEEELEKPEENSGEEPEPEGEAEYSDEENNAEGERIFTYREKAEALCKAMPNSENVYYYVCDFDEQYVYVERCSWNDSGDYSEERGRFEYTYSEADRTASIAGEFEEMVVRWLTKTENEQIDALRGKYEELLAYKDKREEEDHKNTIDAALEPFMDMAGNEEFDSVLNNKYSYESASVLENTCYMIRGKYGLFPKARKNNEPSVPVGAPRTQLTPREKLHKEFRRG